MDTPRDHKIILADAGGPDEVAADFGLSVNTVKAWVQRNRIPAEWWARVAEMEWATTDELARSPSLQRIAA